MDMLIEAGAEDVGTCQGEVEAGGYTRVKEVAQAEVKMNTEVAEILLGLIEAEVEVVATEVVMMEVEVATMEAGVGRDMEEVEVEVVYKGKVSILRMVQARKLERKATQTKIVPKMERGR